MASALYDEFAKLIADQQKMTVREFISARADYRNKLLYAEDAGFMDMEETLEEMLSSFETTYRDLLWTLTALLNNKPIKKEHGLLGQFVGLFRRALTEAKLI